MQAIDIMRKQLGRLQLYLRKGIFSKTLGTGVPRAFLDR